jgi:hypothetical protein
MATFQKFQPFAQGVAEKKHNLSADTLMVALTNAAPLATNGVLADITQISYANLSSRVVTRVSGGQTGGVYNLVLQDLLLTASGAVGPFRYVVLYNDTAANKDLIGFIDYGASIQMYNSGETLLIDFDAAGAIALS